MLGHGAGYANWVHRRWRALACSAVVVALGAVPAAAEVCARSATVAASPPGYFEFAAVSQAKAAWARKVARDPNLGRAYSSWARDPCRSGAKS
jgi:hypothetical protein